MVDFLIEFLTVVAVISGLIALTVVAGISRLIALGAGHIVYSWMVEDQENDQ